MRQPEFLASRSDFDRGEAIFARFERCCCARFAGIFRLENLSKSKAKSFIFNNINKYKSVLAALLTLR